jgi:two-component system, NtrC family, response regulator HydG
MMIEHELNKYWKTVVNTIQEGVMIVDIDGIIVSANQALRRITGYQKKELIGKQCTILNCNRCEILRNENKKHWCRLFVDGDLKMTRCVITKKDGSYTHVLKNASLLYDDKGKEIGAVETLTDITELVEKDLKIEAFQRELRHYDRFHGIIGTSSQMQRVFDMIANASQSDAPVIIFGESGTGKELIARAVHKDGTRKTKPYIKVNCAALNENLLESELFGHVKGAFTGAHQGRKGRFEEASGGDIFLDEIGDLPSTTQVKLLRVLEEKVIERVGDNHSVHVNVRVITATNRNLKQMVKDRKFRKDLYYRINVIPITIPPLRERLGDIPLLAETFFRRISLKNGKPIKGISNVGIDILLNYEWPGNVRELKSAMEYAFVTCQGPQIHPNHLPPDITGDTKLFSKKNRLITDPNEAKKKLLMDALEQSGGNQTRAAEILGITRVTVWNRMKRYGIRSGKSFTYLK